MHLFRLRFAAAADCAALAMLMELTGEQTGAKAALVAIRAHVGLAAAVEAQRLEMQEVCAAEQGRLFSAVPVRGLRVSCAGFAVLRPASVSKVPRGGLGWCGGGCSPEVLPGWLR